MSNQICVLMLENITKLVSELSSPLERWSYLLKDSEMRRGVEKIRETRDIEADVAGDDEAMNEFLHRLDENNFPHDIREHAFRTQREFNEIISDVKAEGLAEGKADGKAEMVNIVMGLIKKGKLTLADVMESDDYSYLKTDLQQRLQDN